MRTRRESVARAGGPSVTPKPRIEIPCLHREFEADHCFDFCADCGSVRAVGGTTWYPADSTGGRLALELHDAEEYVRRAAAADTHSSDVDPGRVDPWEER